MSLYFSNIPNIHVSDTQIGRWFLWIVWIWAHKGTFSFSVFFLVIMEWTAERRICGSASQVGSQGNVILDIDFWHRLWTRFAPARARAPQKVFFVISPWEKWTCPVSTDPQRELALFCLPPLCWLSPIVSWRCFLAKVLQYQQVPNWKINPGTSFH